MNVVVLWGSLSSDPRVRELPSGTTLVNWEVTTEVDGHRLTVPVAWFDPPRSAKAFSGGDAVVVHGTVRRRFYHSTRGTASATEVVAVRACRPSQLVAVRRLLDSVTAALQPHEPAVGP